MHQQTSETFDRNAREALADVQLRGALRNLATTFGGRRVDPLDVWHEMQNEVPGDVIGMSPVSAAAATSPVRRACA